MLAWLWKYEFCDWFALQDDEEWKCRYIVHTQHGRQMQITIIFKGRSNQAYHLYAGVYLAHNGYIRFRGVNPRTSIAIAVWPLQWDAYDLGTGDATRQSAQNVNYSPGVATSFTRPWKAHFVSLLTTSRQTATQASCSTFADAGRLATTAPHRSSAGDNSTWPGSAFLFTSASRERKSEQRRLVRLGLNVLAEVAEAVDGGGGAASTYTAPGIVFRRSCRWARSDSGCLWMWRIVGAHRELVWHDRACLVNSYIMWLWNVR